jgi:hypothetical protein
MGAHRAHIPGEGLRSLLLAGFPLTRIVQARSDLSPPGRGEGRRPNAFDSTTSKSALADRRGRRATAVAAHRIPADRGCRRRGRLAAVA